MLEWRRARGLLEEVVFFSSLKTFKVAMKDFMKICVFVIFSFLYKLSVMLNSLETFLYNAILIKFVIKSNLSILLIFNTDLCISRAS